MKSCAFWLLLLSHLALLGVGCFGCWEAVKNFVRDDPGPPHLPPSDSRTTLQLMSDHASEIRDYIYMVLQPWFYVMVVCGGGAMLAFVMLVTCLCSSNIFSTTASVYSSMSMLVVSFALMMTYQFQLFLAQDGSHLTSTAYVAGLLVGVMLLLTLQVVLGLWELLIQTCSKWPWTPSNIFTLNFIFLIIRVVTGVISTSAFFSSSIMTGLKNVGYYDDITVPVVRYPLWFSLSGAVAVCYSVVVLGESCLSTLFGSYHVPLTRMATMLSAVCNGWVAVLASPVFITALSGHMRVDLWLMISCIVACVVTFLHAILWLLAPRALSTRPSCVQAAAKKLSSCSVLDVAKVELVTNGYSTFPKDFQEGIEKIMKNVDPSTKGRIGLYMATGVSLLCFLVESFSLWRTAVGSGMIMGVNLSLFCRSFPPLVTQLTHTGTVQVISFGQRALRLMTEWLVIVIGSRTPSNGIALLFTIFYFVLETLMLTGVYGDHVMQKKSKKVQETTSDTTAVITNTNT